jgi:N-acetylglucosamine-6-sulfatase
VWKLNKLTTDQEKQLDFHYQCRTEALLSVDKMVERVVETLKQAGQLDNTYIIYTSDNGFHLGHHRLGAGKKYAFEEDINVPLIIRGPGVPKGRTTDLVSAHIDLAPTIMKMAGLKQRADFDGKVIPHTSEAISKREGSAADEHANIEFWVGASYGWANLPHKPHADAGKHKKMKVNTYKSLRLTGKDYDIMYAVHCRNNPHELYNMKKDPVQMHNLHPKAPHSKGHKNAFHSGEHHIAGIIIKRLLPRLDALMLVLKSCKGDECSHPWKQLHPNGHVHSLKQALHHNFDHYYHGLPKVHFRKCFKNGKINLWAEGPQWRPGLAHGAQHEGEILGSDALQTVFGPKEDEYNEIFWHELNSDANDGIVETGDDWDELEDDDDDGGLSAEDWERQGYLDDWE